MQKQYSISETSTRVASLINRIEIDLINMVLICPKFVDWKVMKQLDKRWLFQSREVNCVESKYNAFTNTVCYAADKSKCKVWVQRRVGTLSSCSLKNFGKAIIVALTFILTSRIMNDNPIYLQTLPDKLNDILSPTFYKGWKIIELFDTISFFKKV